jgi:hypothetical protein
MCIRNSELIYTTNAGIRKSIATNFITCQACGNGGELALADKDEIIVYDDAVTFCNSTVPCVDVPSRWRTPVAIGILSVCFGQGWLACATMQTVQVYESHTGVLTAALSLVSRARVIRLDTHSGLLISFQEDSTIVAWDVHTWSRVCNSTGLTSFARTLSVGFGAAGNGSGVVVLALADARVVAACISRHGNPSEATILMIPAAVPLTTLSFGPVFPIHSLLSEAETLYSSAAQAAGECTVGVEVLHKDRASRCGETVEDPIVLVAILTQRRLLIMGVSSSIELRGIAVVSFDVLIDTPIIARSFCFSPAGAVPRLAALSRGISNWTQLVIESLLDGSFAFIEIESVLQTAGKMATGAFRPLGVKDTVDSAPTPLVGPSLLLDRFRSSDDDQDVPSESESEREDTPAASTEVDDRGFESIVCQAPDPSSFLILARTPDFISIDEAGSAASFETQRKMSYKKGTMRGAAPVTFHSKVRSSGYGSAPPKKPSWAKPPPSTHSSRHKKMASIGGVGAISYPTGMFPRDVDEGVLPPLPVAAAARGSSVPGVSGGTQASRSLARSQAAIPCGPVSALAYNNDGSFLAVASHNGSVHAVAMRAIERSMAISVSDIECHSVGTASPVTGVSWSHTLFAGVARILRHPPSSGRAASRGKSPHSAASGESAVSSDNGVVFAGLSAAAAAGVQQAKAAARNKFASANIAGEKHYATPLPSSLFYWHPFTH